MLAWLPLFVLGLDGVRRPATLQDLADLAGGDPRIRYIGYVKDVENVYHTADIVVVPSRWQEPFGLVVGDRPDGRAPAG